MMTGAKIPTVVIVAKKSKDKVSKECQFFDVPRYTGANKTKTKQDKWCFVHAQWNCKDGIIRA